MNKDAEPNKYVLGAVKSRDPGHTSFRGVSRNSVSAHPYLTHAGLNPHLAGLGEPTGVCWGLKKG